MDEKLTLFEQQLRMAHLSGLPTPAAPDPPATQSSARAEPLFKQLRDDPSWRLLHPPRVEVALQSKLRLLEAWRALESTPKLRLNFFRAHYGNYLDRIADWDREIPPPLLPDGALQSPLTVAGLPRVRQLGGGRKPLLSAQEEQKIVDEVMRRRKEALIVTPVDVMTIAMSLFASPGRVFGYRWLHRFLRRQKLSVYHGFHSLGEGAGEHGLSTQQLAEKHCLDLRTFLRTVYTVIARKGYSADQVVLLDECSVSYESAGGLGCIDKEGTARVWVRFDGAKMSGFTVIDAFTCAGRKLPLGIILKGSAHSMPLVADVHQDMQPVVLFRTGAHALTSYVFAKYLDVVSLRAMHGQPWLLCADESPAHTTQVVLDGCQRNMIDMAVLPAKLTAQAQGSDVAVHHGMQLGYKRELAAVRSREGFHHADERQWHSRVVIIAAQLWANSLPPDLSRAARGVGIVFPPPDTPEAAQALPDMPVIEVGPGASVSLADVMRLAPTDERLLAKLMPVLTARRSAAGIKGAETRKRHEAERATLEQQQPSAAVAAVAVAAADGTITTATASTLTVFNIAAPTKKRKGKRSPAVRSSRTAAGDAASPARRASKRKPSSSARGSTKRRPKRRKQEAPPHEQDEDQDGGSGGGGGDHQVTKSMSIDEPLPLPTAPSATVSSSSNSKVDDLPTRAHPTHQHRAPQHLDYWSWDDIAEESESSA